MSKNRGVQSKGYINIELYTIQDLIDIIIKKDHDFNKVVPEKHRINTLLKKTYVELLLWANRLENC